MRLATKFACFTFNELNSLTQEGRHILELSTAQAKESKTQREKCSIKGLFDLICFWYINIHFPSELCILLPQVVKKANFTNYPWYQSNPVNEQQNTQLKFANSQVCVQQAWQARSIAAKYPTFSQGQLTSPKSSRAIQAARNISETSLIFHPGAKDWQSG